MEMLQRIYALLVDIRNQLAEIRQLLQAIYQQRSGS